MEEQSFEIPAPLPHGQGDWEGTVEDLESDSLSSNCAGRIRNARGRAWGDRGGRHRYEVLRNTEMGWRRSLRGQLSKWLLCYGDWGAHQAEGKRTEGAETRRQGIKECHREGWSMWQPTGEEDVDFTTGCPLREDMNRALWGEAKPPKVQSQWIKGRGEKTVAAKF